MKHFFSSSNKKTYVIISVLFAVLIIVGISFHEKGKKTYSRKVMEYAEMVVMEDMKVTPPEAARFYAYVSTMYYSVLKSEGNARPAIIASAKLIDQVYPKDVKETQHFLTTLNLDEKINFSPETQKLVNDLLAKERDERALKKEYKRPEGKEYWSGENPLSRDTIYWQRWNLSKEYTNIVPPPPVDGSDEQKRAIESLVQTTNDRTTEQGALINFWSGMHMTNSLSGIWQDRLYAVVKNKRLTDEQYAYAQMILAQSLSDAFIEAWKIKYTYWTKRPSAYDSRISISMEDPNYPSYVSEYGAVAMTASEVLSAFFPEFQDIWKEDARNNSNIGVWAGCAFSYDEEIGRVLGSMIGKEYLQKLNISAVK